MILRSAFLSANSARKSLFGAIDCYVMKGLIQIRERSILSPKIDHLPLTEMSPFLLLPLLPKLNKIMLIKIPFLKSLQSTLPQINTPLLSLITKYPKYIEQINK